jgi:hypothetical protein
MSFGRGLGTFFPLGFFLSGESFFRNSKDIRREFNSMLGMPNAVPAYYAAPYAGI